MISAGGRARFFIFMHAQMAKQPTKRISTINPAPDAINNMGISSGNKLFKAKQENEKEIKK